MSTYVSAVTVYGDFCSRTLSIREAIEFAETHDVKLMLGAMREDGSGREMVVAEDVARWVHEDDDAAMWGDVAAGEQFAADNGLLR